MKCSKKTLYWEVDKFLRDLSLNGLEFKIELSRDKPNTVSINLITRTHGKEIERLTRELYIHFGADF